MFVSPLSISHHASSPVLLFAWSRMCYFSVMPAGQILRAWCWTCSHGHKLGATPLLVATPKHTSLDLGSSYLLPVLYAGSWEAKCKVIHPHPPEKPNKTPPPPKQITNPPHTKQRDPTKKNQNKPYHMETQKKCVGIGEEGSLAENNSNLCQMSCHGFTIIFPLRGTEFSLLWNLRCELCCSWEKSYVRIQQCFQIWLAWADKQWMSTQPSRKSLSCG